MTVFRPKYLTEARAVLKAAERIVNYRRDIATPELIEQTKARSAALKAATRERSEAKVKTAQAALIEVLEKIHPPQDSQMIREYAELALVVVVIALGLRTYYLQPFKIPTGSMQPTLNGVIAHRIDSEPPNPVVRAFEFLTLGRTYENVVSAQDDQILGMEPVKLKFFWDGTSIQMASGQVYRVGIERDVLRGQLGIFPGERFAQGQPIVRAYADLGDQLFVDKVSYNFVSPNRGDVFVFKTNQIAGIAVGPEGYSEHYIKRLAGLPGDVLQIRAPNLYINEKLATAPPFARVASMKNGYHGYTNDMPNDPRMIYLGTPDATVKVESDGYFALGDNSPQSADSRYWGFVPRQNVVGRGLFVYWPFTSHWGFVQ